MSRFKHVVQNTSLMFFIDQMSSLLLKPFISACWKSHLLYVIKVIIGVGEGWRGLTQSSCICKWSWDLQPVSTAFRSETRGNSFCSPCWVNVAFPVCFVPSSTENWTFKGEDFQKWHFCVYVWTRKTKASQSCALLAPFPCYVIVCMRLWLASISILGVLCYALHGA